MTNVVLLAGDVDSIKQYVFETSSLPQIRGGSQLLVECEEKIKNLLHKEGGEEIYCSGGAFLFEVPSERAENIKETIENIYLEHTQTATVTVAYENISFPSTHSSLPQDRWAKRLLDGHQHAQQSGDFAQRVAFLSAQVRRAKNQRRSVPFFEALPFGRRCEACGKRVALEEVPRYEPEVQKRVEMVALCAVCLQRHKTGVRSQGHKVRGRFNQRFHQQHNPVAVQPPDLDYLVESPRRKYVAFLYADGNDIGKLLQMVKSKDEFKALSKALEEGSKQALFDALHQACGQELQEAGRYWPFEIVNIGGDDVTLLIQAGYAWEVAVKFLEGFETHVQRRVQEKLGHWPDGWPKKITASCGIVVADVKYPVRYLDYLAGDLLKQAKQEAKGNPDNPQSTVTFLWLPNAVAAEKAETLMLPYRLRDDTLTARPYALEKAKKLTELAEQAVRWPRSLRYRWAQSLEHGKWVSLCTLYYDIARRREEDRPQFSKFLFNVGQLAKQKEYRTDAPAPLWQVYEVDGRKTGWRTALLDVLELAELRAMRPDVREEEEG